MASLNDNLFTILMDSFHPHSHRAYLRTHWGTLKMERQANRLQGMVFDDHPSTQAVDDCLFKISFMHCLRDFQQMPPRAQWRHFFTQGTRFQRAVWRALLEIPLGQTVGYKQVATQMGQPGAARAVGSAIAANPMALLIPCHRVVPSAGGTGNYRWGSARKQALLDAEALHGCDWYQLL